MTPDGYLEQAREEYRRRMFCRRNRYHHVEPEEFHPITGLCVPCWKEYQGENPPRRLREIVELPGGTVVYAIGSSVVPLTKIGITTDLVSRVASMRADYKKIFEGENHQSLEVLWWSHDYAAMEQAIHWLFNPFREHGEWFNLPCETLDIPDLMDDACKKLRELRADVLVPLLTERARAKENCGE